MRFLARPFAFLIALGWSVFWAGALFLMWRPEYQATLDFPNFSAVGNITAGGLERLLATLVGLAALAMAVPVLLGAVMPAGRRVVERPAERGRQPKAATGAQHETRELAAVPPGEDREMTALRERLDRQEEEIRRLREAVTSTDAHVDRPTQRAA